MSRLPVESGGRVRLKVCGITRLEDARIAAELGVDALGFIFFEKSPRNIDDEHARRIIRALPPFVHRVGVFVDASLAAIRRKVELGLTVIQLHGKESPEFCRTLSDELPNCTILKAFRVGGKSRAADFTPYEQVVSGFLLDTYQKGVAGGTGETFNWALVSGLQLRLPVILAGGLNPTNVARAVSEVKPYGIDLNSGVEAAPGVKDHHKLQAVVAAIRSSLPPPEANLSEQ